MVTKSYMNQVQHKWLINKEISNFLNDYVDLADCHLEITAQEHPMYSLLQQYFDNTSDFEDAMAIACGDILPNQIDYMEEEVCA